MSFTQVGTVEVGPSDREVLVGSFSMSGDHDSIWFRVQQSAPTDYFKYAYGLLTWRTSFGKELGTIKVYGDPASEVYRLSNGLKPLDSSGQVYFTPRAYNRRWVSIEDPPLWTLNFEAQSGVSTSVPIDDVVRPITGVLSDTDRLGISWAIRDGYARIATSPK